MIRELLAPIFVNDEALINDVQLIVGSCLTGRSCRKLFLFHGGGSNGKSTLKDMIARVLGDFYGIMSRKVIIDGGSKENANSHTSHLTPLKGLRVGICDEIRENDKLNVEIMKQLASGESIKVRQLGKEESKIDLILKGIVCLNDIPRFDGGDQAIVDRLCCVPFDCRFVDKPSRQNEVKSSVAFREKLKSGYLAQEFLAWAVQGSIRGYNEGFNFKSEKLLAKTRDIALEEDPLQAFIKAVASWKTMCPCLVVQQWTLCLGPADGGSVSDEV
jgi:putative DNA primase/helicase